MKILNYNAAILLFDKVRGLSHQSHETWRCVYLNISRNKQLRYNEGLRTHFVVKAISDMLAENEGFIYLCEDGDVFILFQGALKPILLKLASHFADLDPNQPLNLQHGMFTIFDLSKHWQSFFEVCENKYLEAQSIADNSRAFFASYHSPARQPIKAPSA